MNLKLNYIDGKRFCLFSLCGHGIDTQVRAAQSSVFAKFGIEHNQIDVSHFPSHGLVIDEFIKQTSHLYDFVGIMDVDAIGLRPDFLQVMYDKIKDGKTLAGGVQQSNHLVVDGTVDDPYISAACLFTSMGLYNAIGRHGFPTQLNVRYG